MSDTHLFLVFHSCMYVYKSNVSKLWLCIFWEEVTGVHTWVKYGKCLGEMRWEGGKVGVPLEIAWGEVSTLLGRSCLYYLIQTGPFCF